MTKLSYETLVELVRHRAAATPDQLCYAFLDDHETITARLTYAELDRRARAIASELARRAAPGSRVLMLYPQSLDFITGFFGCLYAHLLAVPAYPPRVARNLGRLKAIVADAGAQLTLTNTALARQPQMAELASELGAPLFATDTVDDIEAERWQPPGIDDQAVAFLQYTSGSTGDPKGVVVTHGNLLANLEDLDRGWRHDAQSVMVSWLPLFHDMGLIYGALSPVYKGFPCYLMDPATFLKRPVEWLAALSRYRGTHTSAPNFAYELCVRRTRPEQRAGLDLRSVRVMMNGAEPIRLETLQQFADTFAPHGLARDVICPGYGLAEATLKVAAAAVDEPIFSAAFDAKALEAHRVVALPAGDPAARILVGCGRSTIDTEVVIVEPDTAAAVPADRVGEIWVAGDTVAKGYWRNPDATRTTFHSYLADGRGPFLRTGDLGFVYRDQLIITGRLKDLLIVEGRNIYPSDVETAAESISGDLRPGCSAAFALSPELGGPEQVAVVCELRQEAEHSTELARLISAIRAEVAQAYGVELATIVLVRQNTIPKTSSGKIQRRLTRQELQAGRLSPIARWDRPAAVAPSLPDHGRIQELIVAAIAQVLRISLAEVRLDEPLAHYGMTSATAMMLVGELERVLDRSLPVTLLYNHQTAAALVAYACGGTGETRSRAAGALGYPPIAIVGRACRMPGARDFAGFARLLRDGGDAVGPMPASRRRGDGELPQAGYLDDVAAFDAGFFAIPARAAQQMDPQQRLVLETAFHALESAGIAVESLAGSATGVYIGVSTHDYERVQAHLGSDSYTLTGQAASIVANRVSYAFDLRGPSMAIDTACSSSLTAMHMACRALHTGEIDVALVGGVNLLLDAELTRGFAEAGMMAPGQRCRTFDASAEGYVRGEGCGVVVLRRLDDARRDGDRVFAVVRGSAVNQDGRSNGLTAPNGLAQRAVIRRALAEARLSPAQLGYVEAHGTGTALGDPIEMEALAAVFGEGPPRTSPLWVGSVKARVGHLEAAAGMASLMKVLAAFADEQVSAQLHFRQLNPKITLGDALRIAAEPVAWPRGSRPRIAGVSGFSFGGTNAHVVLEEGAAAHAEAEDHQVCIAALSARDRAALQQLARAYAEQLAHASDAQTRRWLAAALTGRSQHAVRMAVTADRPAALVELLARFAADGKPSKHVRVSDPERAAAPRVAFLFSGQGVARDGAAGALYAELAIYRAAVDAWAARFAPYLPEPLQPVLCRPQAAGDDPRMVQAALFTHAMALTAWWRALGVEPEAVAGHSLGEYAAAVVAGYVTEDQAAQLVACRAELIASLPADGAMAAILLDEPSVAAVLRELAEGLDIAAVNGPANTVISGDAAVVARAIERFARDGVRAHPLAVDRAFHSRRMEPIQRELAERIAALQPGRPRVLLVDHRGGAAGADFATAGYWVRQLREPVQFGAALASLTARGIRYFVEIGPGTSLSALAAGGDRVAIPSLRPARPPVGCLLDGLAQLFVAGAAVQWRALTGDLHGLASELPAYPFQRQAYWFDDGERAAAVRPASTRALASRAPRYQVVWHPAEPRDPGAGERERWLIVAGGDPGLAGGIAAALAETGAVVRTAAASERGASEGWIERGASEGWIERGASEGWIERGASEGWIEPDALPAACSGILFAWGSTAASESTDLAAEALAACTAWLAVIQTLCTIPVERAPRLWLVTRGAVASEPGATACPASASLWGMARAFQLEHPQRWGGMLNVETAIGDAVRSALRHDASDGLAVRGGALWAPRLVAAPSTPPQRAAISSEHAYLITGGTGGLGLQLAHGLVAAGARYLVLIARTPAAEPAIHALRARGVEVVTVAADVTDEPAMSRALADFGHRRPPLGGVFHLAGIATLAPLATMTTVELAETLRAKANGAWLLHRLTLPHRPAYFVMFSSIAAVWGGRQQGHYAAANAFLDGLCHMRRARGLPATSINWGPWAGAGMAGEEFRSQLQKLGISALAPEAAMDQLFAQIATGAGHAVIADVAWPQFRAVLEAQRARPLFAALGAPVIASDPEPPRGGWRAELTELPAHKRRDHLTRRIRGLVAELIGMKPPSLPSVTTGLFDLGLDSLMAIEMLRRLRDELALELDATLTFDQPSIAALTGYLATRLDAHTAEPGVAAPEVLGDELDHELAQLESLLRNA